MRIFTLAALSAVVAGILFVFPISAQNVRLRAQITPPCDSQGSSFKYADIYADGNIAVQGSYNCRGAFIYDISNPDAPFLAGWYNPGNNQQFLEAIVVGDRGYFGSGNGGGVHIVDLSNPASPQLLGVVNSTNGNGLNSIHEMLVWGNFLIENANTLSNKVIKVINISNPAAPVFIRDITPTEPRWVHAMHIRGNRMFTSGWGTSTLRGRTEIYDISNLGTQAPTLLGFIEDPSPNTTAGNNMHSSWTSEDGNFLYSARETLNGTGDLRVYDITNPATPLLVKSIKMADLGLNAVTPHNPVVMGNYLYVSWYQAGVQVFDISDKSNPKRVGQYDTFPAEFAPSDEELKALANAEPWDLICSSEFRQNVLPTTYDGNWAVYPFLGASKVLAGDLTYGLLVLDAGNVSGTPRNKIADFDGDGRTDLSEISDDTTWSIEQSSDGSPAQYGWGVPGDKLVNGDFDADGRADVAIWRPSNGTWYLIQSSGGLRVVQWGANGDVPVPGDYDADGRTDLAVWRPSTGLWYIVQSTLGIRTQKWGVDGDKPLTGDYDLDGKDDVVIWRPSNGNWYIIQSSTTRISQTGWGQTGDRPLAADFNGDGRADLTVFRPSNNTWYIFDPATSFFRTQTFGTAGDVPVPADYDGDRISDVAVYRPGNRLWYRLNSSNGGFVVRSLNSGQTSNIEPVPASANPE
ncbi:MAG: FG-GAP-like repeat-containing protein [Pyrinomonadaceae bacterium]